MNFRVLRAWDWDIFELATARCKETGLKIENGVRNFDEINWSLAQGTHSDSELGILSVSSNIDNIDLIIGVICGRSKPSNKIEMNRFFVIKGIETGRNFNAKLGRCRGRYIF